MPILFVRKSKVEDDAILRAAAKMEPKLSAAFLKAVEAMKGKVDMKKLAAAVARGDADAALAVLALDDKFVDALGGKGFEAKIGSFRDAVQMTFSAGAKAAIDALPRSVVVDFSFDLTSREAAMHLATYQFDLIREITANTKEAIRQTIANAFQVGGNPIEQARTIRNSIGLTARQELAVENFERALGSTSSLRQALSRSLRDGRYDPSILRALENKVNLTPQQIAKMVARYRERYLKYRAEAIARTESIRASNKGQRELWKQAVSRGLLPKGTKRIWIISGDDRTCNECLKLDGRKAGFDQEFSPGIFEPPDPHPTCRCTTALDL